MLTALTRKPSEALANCGLTYLARTPIDSAAAVRQHEGYEACLAQLGSRLVSLPAEPDLPDSVFVEDPCFVVEEVAVICRSGALSRRRESVTMAHALGAFRTVLPIVEPGTLEGGDILRVGRRIYAGVSTRSNREGVAQLQNLLEPFGYRVHPVEVRESLHLKTACTSVGENVLWANRAWFDPSAFAGFEILDTPLEEPWSANTLRVGSTILVPASFPRAAEALDRRGYKVATADISEFQKAEGGLTCLSVLFEA